jgi:hypothetical protein
LPSANFLFLLSTGFPIVLDRLKLPQQSKRVMPVSFTVTEIPFSRKCVPQDSNSVRYVSFGAEPKVTGRSDERNHRRGSIERNRDSAGTLKTLTDDSSKADSPIVPTSTGSAIIRSLVRANAKAPIKWIDPDILIITKNVQFSKQRLGVVTSLSCGIFIPVPGNAPSPVPRTRGTRSARSSVLSQGEAL